MRHHGTDVPLDLVEQPAPIGGGADQRSVAPFMEVPVETFLAKVVLHLAGTFDDGLHHLQSPRGPMGWPVVSPIPWGFHGGGGRTEVLEPLRIQCGVVLPQRATIRRRIESRSRPVAGPPVTEETFQRHHLHLDTPWSGEKTPSKVRQKNP